MKFTRFACSSVLALSIGIITGQARAEGVDAQATAATDPPAAAIATTAADGTDANTIVVTATKTGAMSLQAVPLAIQAFSSQTLKERNINSIADLVASVPGAYQGQNQSVASASYNLRGAGGSNANGDSPIGYYLDDVPFVVTNFGIAPPVRFIDIKQVEVLRGPQGTIYGQGSSGGVFIFRTRDPNLTRVEGVVEGESAYTDGASALSYGISGAISVPIVKDVFAVRVSGGHSYAPGWADAYFGNFNGKPDQKNVNVIRNDDIRVVGLLKPASNVSIKGQYWHFRPRQQFLAYTFTGVNPPYYANTAGQGSFGNGDFKLLSLGVTVDFDTFTITSSTSHLKGNFGINRPLTPSGFFSSQFFPKMFSQEVRANSTTHGPLHWLIGASYNDGQGPQDNQLFSPTQNTNASNNTLTKNYAVFGQLSYDLFDGKLVPLAGLRYYHDKRSFEDATTSNTNSTNRVDWRASLNYLPNRNLTIFFSAATGFRSGIVQSKIQADLLQQSGVPAGTQLDPETSTDYEVGVKWQNPSRTLSANLNGYITKYKDLQTSTPTINPSISGFANFGDATTKGIDFEFTWRTPLKGFDLSFVGNVNTGSFDRVVPAVQAALPYLAPGTRIVNTIEQNWRVDASYNGSLGGEWEDFFNVSWSHSGNRLQSNGLYAHPYELFGATLGVRRGPYELALVGTNLSNERGPIIIFGNNPNSGSVPTPRTIGLRFRANFQ